MSDTSVDLVLDLNSEDDTGLPWGFVDEAPDPARIREGAWIVVGSGTAALSPRLLTSRRG